MFIGKNFGADGIIQAFKSSRGPAAQLSFNQGQSCLDEVHDVGEGGPEIRVVAVMTRTAETVETLRLRHGCHFALYEKTREGCNCRKKEHPRAGGLDKVRGIVDPRALTKVRFRPQNRTIRFAPIFRFPKNIRRTSDHEILLVGIVASWKH